MGVADDRTVFVSFEGQATEHTPMFNGIDRIVFNHDLTKIVEVESKFSCGWVGGWMIGWVGYGGGGSSSAPLPAPV